MAPTAADPIALVESAYRWTTDERAWLDAILATAAPYDVGGGVIACTATAHPTTTVRAIDASANTAPADVEQFHRVVAAFPPALARQVFAPAELVGSAGHRLGRIASSASGALGQAAAVAARELPGMWGLVSGAPRAGALLICFPHGRRRPAPDDPFPHAGRRALALAGAHLGAALRLRQLAHAAPHADDAETEAVLSPGGRVLHAEGAARTDRARASLGAAVLAATRARGDARRAAPDTAVAEWTALVQGRWTILETVERDGKRLVLARRNPLGTDDLLALPPDERDVAWLAAYGHSYKFIAYELGVPLGTVATRLRRAMRKLGVTSRRELLRRLGTSSESPKEK
ncbi:MAG: helix-turn-helix transcriptional regulator [Myxococcales bacterium]|nr:helix-turn-helix transcriptional regulator [Myxococcales bacterium]